MALSVYNRTHTTSSGQEVELHCEDISFFREEDYIITVTRESVVDNPARSVLAAKLKFSEETRMGPTTIGTLIKHLEFVKARIEEEGN